MDLIPSLASTEKQMIFKKGIKMWKKELLKNKLYALVLILIGLVPILIERDGTFLYLL